MDQTSPSLSGAEAIRSLKDDDAIFQAFDAYPWKKDPMFISGLVAILGDPASRTSQESLQDMATHARVFYYAQRIGVTIDFAKYQSWLAQHPSHQPVDVLPDEYRMNAESNDQDRQNKEPRPVLSWQQAAPKAELYVNRQTMAQSAPSGDEPNYPMAFAEMLKLLQEGKPIPGIRQIPNTVVRDASVKPVGLRPVPRKPWEKDIGATPTPDIGVEKTLDADFPPLETEGSVTASATSVAKTD